MRIVVVEDHVMFRDVIRKVCATDLGHEVVGETGSGMEAVQLILRHRPDLAILDLALPDLDGFSVAAQVRKTLPARRILVLSCHCDDYTIFRVGESGVHGFVDKTTNTVAELCEALGVIDQGRCYFSPTFVAAKRARRADPKACTKILSEREITILSLIGQGLSDEEIGEHLEIAPRTAQTHRTHILQKLEIRSTPKLIAFAQAHGFSSLAARG